MNVIAQRKSANEAQTETDLIYPLLEELGWTEWDVQANASARARQDVPDALLFPDKQVKEHAAKLEPWKRFQHGLCIVEAKRWGRLLDREEKERKGEEGTPSSQILRYLRVIDDRTKGKLRWGILTNGRIWRLYYQGALSVAEDFLEIDLGKVLDIKGCGSDLLDQRPEGFDADQDWREHALKLFALLFGRDAFLPDHKGETFHALALKEGERWEAKVTKTLSNVVFDEVFPILTQALATTDPQRPTPLSDEYLADIRQNALLFLYRLLFVLYAEDRNLLPDETGPYAEVCLTKMRQEIADKKARDVALSERFQTYWPRLRSIFCAISKGDDALGIPPYNGGLFDPLAAPVLERAILSDAVMANVIFALSHDGSDATRMPKYINYRDLSVRQLGSVYERLLEYQLASTSDSIQIILSPFGRKNSGSYYTPDELVKLIISRAVGPLVDEATEKFRDRAQSTIDKEALEQSDPALALLNLKICDPAMGSGHFLVSLVDWLTDRTLEAMAAAEMLVANYSSPLNARISDIRAHILEQAQAHQWPNVDRHLDNKHIVRRMILKRCIYGADLNPMAVELAKVALWLHSFTVGAPLSFLDHHLICGNSLFGERIHAVTSLAYGGNLLISTMVQGARGAVREMGKIETLTDADIAEARNSSELYKNVKKVTHDLRSFMDLLHGLRWADNGDKARKRAIMRLQKGDFGDPVALLNGKTAPPPLSAAQKKLLTDKSVKLTLNEKKKKADAEDLSVLPQILLETKAVAARENFLHWEVSFPGVWTNWEDEEAEGGFDAIIGNPPWDRMKFQEVEWFADRAPEIAHAPRAADRKKMAAKLLKSGKPIVKAYNDAFLRAEGSIRAAQKCGAYPLLSSGDVNLYSLFVERAQSLVKSKGIVGLLTPSGIASDKSASEFFKSVATSGRLGALIDFENRRGKTEPFFPDVDSRFKFCSLIFGGKERIFQKTQCAFFLHDVKELEDSARSFALSPKDFIKVNPNTGTAPVFRNRRDTEITMQVYDRLPVLVNRRYAKPRLIYDIRYMRMFDMTNDSELFVTKRELEKTAYPVKGGQWRRGSEEFVPLNVGRTIWHYDHRASSVIVNEENLHNVALSSNTTEQQHADPSFSPTPQYWVSTSAVDWPKDVSTLLAFRDITNPTNARTMIAAFTPFCGTNNKLPLLLPIVPKKGKESRALALAKYRDNAPLLLANFNAITFDYIVRRKIHGTNLNWYIVEQLPVVPPEAYARSFGDKTARVIVYEEVLALTYTAHDMASFAVDMGYSNKKTGKVKPPFKWNAEDRLRRRAKLDALYFMLMFPSETQKEIANLLETAEYIYSTFPIVEREEIAAYDRYLSKEYGVAFIKAFAANDPDADIKF